MSVGVPASGVPRAYRCLLACAGRAVAVVVAWRCGAAGRPCEGENTLYVRCPRGVDGTREPQGLRVRERRCGATTRRPSRSGGDGAEDVDAWIPGGACR